MEMQFIKLWQLQYQKKSKRKAWDWNSSGVFRFFTSSQKQSKWIEEADFIGPALIFGTWGSASIHYCNDSFSSSTDCFVLKSDRENIDMKYLYYFLRTNIAILENGFKGAGLKHISKEYLSEIQIPLPPLEEQRSIVAKLDKLIDLIDLKKEAIWKTEELTKSVFSKIFLTGNLPEKSLSELVERIQIWPFGTQLHFSDYIENWIPLINPTNIKNGIIIPDFSNTITFEKAQSLSEYFLKEGDVIMWRRWEMWRCALVKIVEQGWFCWTGSLYLRPGKRISWLYLSNLLQTDKYKKILENESRGATMPNLNKGIISKLPIPIPPIEDTEKYYKITNYYAEVIENQNQSLQKLQELYNTTTQELFSF